MLLEWVREFVFPLGTGPGFVNDARMRWTSPVPRLQGIKRSLLKQRLVIFNLAFARIITRRDRKERFLTLEAGCSAKDFRNVGENYSNVNLFIGTPSKPARTTELVVGKDSLLGACGKEQIAKTSLSGGRYGRGSGGPRHEDSDGQPCTRRMSLSLLAQFLEGPKFSLHKTFAVPVSGPTVNVVTTVLRFLNREPRGPDKNPENWIWPRGLRVGISVGWAYIHLDVFAGTIPWSGLKDAAIAMKVTVEKKRLPYPKHLRSTGHAELWWEVMTKCWAYEPQDRSTLHDLMQALHVIGDILPSHSPGASFSNNIDGSPTSFEAVDFSFTPTLVEFFSNVLTGDYNF
ncbi:hypothetical protein IW262DRAFT_1297927 [Armillaria fumosa]|nr:hypothetical protein IW262DRAFT_1297927 [Armillaria fumosa]